MTPTIPVMTPAIAPIFTLAHRVGVRSMARRQCVRVGAQSRPHTVVSEPATTPKYTNPIITLIRQQKRKLPHLSAGCVGGRSTRDPLPVTVV